MPSNISKILAFIGDGEGKTSAAIGHAVRAAGHGNKTAIIQFLKGRTNAGEYLYFKSLNNPLVEIHLSGDQDFLMPGSDKKKHAEKANNGLALAKRLITSDKYFLVVLDEILDAQAAGLISVKDIIELFGLVRTQRAMSLHIILTGRVLPPEISSQIDLITRMQKIKHYFDKDGNGVSGLDW